jgi:hypothetical protein
MNGVSRSSGRRPANAEPNGERKALAELRAGMTDTERESAEAGGATATNDDNQGP